MEQPLEIAFHGVPSSNALSAFIEAESLKLERFGKAVVSARVSVERVQTHGASDVDEIHVDVQARGHHLFTSATVEHRHRHRSDGVYNGVTRAIDLAPKKWTPGYAARSSACSGVMVPSAECRRRRL